MRSLVVAVLLVALVLACEQRRDPPVVAKPAITPAPGTAPRPSPPPPPPPPPPLPAPQPPPVIVATFLQEHAADTVPWRVTYARGRVRKRLTPAQAAELARRLGDDDSYVDGDYGCVGDPVNYVVARGPAAFTFIEECGHMKIGADVHAAMFSEEMLEFLQRSRGDR